MLRVFVLLVLSGCGFGTHGSLHEVPSTGADLPFAAGVYVLADTVAACPGVGPNVTLDSTRASRRWRVIELRNDGTFTQTDSITDLTGPLRVEHGLRVDVRGWRGTYRVVGDAVEGRVLADGGDSGARWVVISTVMQPTGPTSFGVDHADSWWYGDGMVETCVRALFQRVAAPVGASVTVTE